MIQNNFSISNFKIDINNYKDFINNYNNYFLIKIKNLIYIKKKGTETDLSNKVELDMKKIADFISYFYCPVVYNARLKNHKLIVADNLNLDNINSKRDWYNSIKIYDSVTLEPITEKFQLKLSKDENDVTSMDILFLSTKQIKKLIKKFQNFTTNSNLELRFIPEGKKICNEVLFDKNTNKPIHILLNHSRSSDKIIGMDNDCRLKALKEYYEFKKRKLRIIGDVNERIKFVYEDTNEDIPEHLQLDITNCNNGSNVELVMPKFHYNDPRYECLNEYIEYYNNSNKVIKVRKDEIFLNPDNEKYKDYCRVLKDGTYLGVVDAYGKDKTKKTLYIQYLLNNNIKIYTDGDYMITNGIKHIKAENKRLCERCEKFVFQLFDESICINCLEYLIKKKKIKRRKINK